MSAALFDPTHASNRDGHELPLDASAVATLAAFEARVCDPLAKVLGALNTGDDMPDEDGHIAAAKAQVRELLTTVGDAVASARRADWRAWRREMAL